MFVFLQTGFMVGYLLLFGNEMLLTSFFASSLITVTVSIVLYTVISSPEP